MNSKDLIQKYAIDATIIQFPGAIKSNKTTSAPQQNQQKQKIDEIQVYYNAKLLGSKPVFGIPGTKPREYVNEKEARQFAKTFKMWDAVGYKNSVFDVFRPTYADLKKMGRVG